MFYFLVGLISKIINKLTKLSSTAALAHFEQFKIQNFNFLSFPTLSQQPNGAFEFWWEKIVCKKKKKLIVFNPD